MKTIGMIVAVELQSVLKRYGAKLVKRKETAGYQVLEYETDQYRMVIVNCGPGEIAADQENYGNPLTSQQKSAKIAEHPTNRDALVWLNGRAHHS